MSWFEECKPDRDSEVNYAVAQNINRPSVVELGCEPPSETSLCSFRIIAVAA